MRRNNIKLLTRSFLLEETLPQAQRLCVGCDHLGLLTSFAIRSYIGKPPYPVFCGYEKANEKKHYETSHNNEQRNAILYSFKKLHLKNPIGVSLVLS